MSYTLRMAVASPFVRKVRIAAAILGLDGDIKLDPSDTQDNNDSILQQNPLGKIPALILEDGRVLYDSRVIVEYLDAVAGGGKLIPTQIDARFEALRVQALGDGIADAAILIVYETRFRPDQAPNENWLARQRGKNERALDSLEAAPPSIDPVDVGAIAVACALGYLDFRKQVDWRARNPGLISWVDDFAAAVPSHYETRPDA
ncbi:MAG: glutathione S-transferase N-terminal domain-containing protein [Rhodospirillales bacterium]|nr:glutathione S-transferase N-terminal domain-containing protein [Rhodospirillales bacterium]